MSDKCFECESELTKTCLSCNTRAAPDVPELVAVSHEVFYAPTREWRKTVEPEYYRKNGDLVRDLIDKSKAAEIIAAKDAKIERLSQSSNQADQSLVDKYRDPQSGLFNFPTDVAKIVRRLEAAEAKLAQYEAQEPVAYKVYGHIRPYFFRHEPLSEFEINIGFSADPLYASPVPAPDLKAENEKLREALKPFAEYMKDYGDKDNLGAPVPDAHGVGWIYLNHGHFRAARAALNVEANDGL